LMDDKRLVHNLVVNRPSRHIKDFPNQANSLLISTSADTKVNGLIRTDRKV
jgi:hypothetical protein